MMKVHQQRFKILAGLTSLLSLGFILGGAILFFLNTAELVLFKIEFVGPFSDAILVLGYGIVGLLILSYKPNHGIGWLFLGVSFLTALNLFAEQYALYGLLVKAVPWALWMAWLQTWLFYLIFPAPVFILFLLFPTGRLPSPRWRFLVWLGILSSLSLVLGELIKSGIMVVYIADKGIELGKLNPTGIPRWAGVSEALNATWMLSVGLMFAALVAPIWRYRHAQSLERKQLKWFVYFSVFILLLVPVAFIQGGLIGESILWMQLLILPIATAIAIFRHQLYDIDIIIRRTLQYGLLTGILALVYFILVVLLQSMVVRGSGDQSPLVIVFSTLAIAALFNPLRIRIQDFIDRRFYRKKYDAEQALVHFSTVARDEVNISKITHSLLNAVEDTMQPELVSLWLVSAVKGAVRATSNRKEQNYGSSSKQ